jgi:signal transduction histidine kinase
MGSATVDAGPGSQAGFTLLSSEPVVVADLFCENRFTIPAVLPEHAVRSGMSVIIHGQTRPFGTLGAFTRRLRSFTPDDVLFLQAVANVLGTAIERRRLEEERARHSQELAARVLQAQEEERKRIARELHDETAQTLSVLLANLDLLEQRLPGADGRLRAGFEQVGILARRALDETRALSHDLRPTILDDVGLVAALEWLAADYELTYGGAVRVEVGREPGHFLSPELEVALFRIAQEALTNSGKHAGARNVRVSLSCSDSSVKLVIEDDGRGFDLDHVAGPTREGRLGLYGMRERAGLLGGRLQIQTDPGRGTRIVAEIPRSKRGSTRPAVLEGPRGAGRRYEVAPRVGASV